MRRLPISVAKRLAQEYGKDQVIIWAWDKKSGKQHVATFGKTTDDCDQAAQGGNAIKKQLLGWPESECLEEPRRVQKLKEKIRKLEETIHELR